MQHSLSSTQRPLSPLEGDEPDIIGMPPEFNGDKANTLSFLISYKNFIRLNSNTRIAKDPSMRAAYFLNMLRGPPSTIVMFVHESLNWLSEVESNPDNPDLLPEGMNVWEALEANFKKSFEDHLGPEKARAELDKIYMKEDGLDDYIADFERLARRAGYEPIRGPTLYRFFRGLPRELAKACTNHENPETFDQWVGAARREYSRWQARNRLRQPPNRRGPTFFERHNGQPGRQDIVPRARVRTTPSDSNRGMTAGTNRKAVTAEDKERYLRKGLCFYCGTHGHIVRVCPNRPPRPTSERK